MAEAIARAALERRRIAGLSFSSAGTSAWGGTPASDAALLVLLERKLHLETHRARPLTRSIVGESDLILGMGPHHVERAIVLGGEGRTHLLTDYAGANAAGEPVDDPFGGDLDAYRATAERLQDLIERMLDRIEATGAPGA